MATSREKRATKLKERLQALYLIKAEKMSISALALVLGRHRSTVQRWLADYRTKGLEGLLEFGVSSGRQRVIPDWAVASLKKQLEEPGGKFQRYTQIQSWLESVLGVEAEYATVHHLTRYRLKAKLKVPRPLNRKQDSQKRLAFKKTSVTT